MKKLIAILSMFLIASSLFAQKADSLKAVKQVAAVRKQAVVVSKQPAAVSKQDTAGSGQVINAPANTGNDSLQKKEDIKLQPPAYERMKKPEEVTPVPCK